MVPRDINESIMELIFMISAMKRDGARKVYFVNLIFKVTCIVPFFAYSR